MADRFVHTHIQRLRLFERLTNEQLNVITEAFQVMRFEPGEVIFQQGQPARGLYMFVSGLAALVQTGPDGIDRQIGVVGENQYLNEAALFRQITETASLRVVQTSLVLVLSRQRLMTVLAHHPDIKAALGIPITQQAQASQASAFVSQRENERVVLATRRHWWAIMNRTWLIILLAIGLIIVGAISQSALLATSLVGLGLIVPGLWLVYAYLEWRNDEIIITDQRVVRIEREIPTFSTNISEFPLESIHEANAEIPATDPFARLLNYGTVELKTAGQAGNIVLDHLANPEHLQRLIFEQQRRKKQSSTEKQREAIRAEVDKLLSTKQGQPPPAAGSTDPQPSPTGQGRRSLLATRFTGADGATIYRKHYLVWLKHVFVPALAMFAGLVIFILDLFLPLFRDLGIVGFVLAFFVTLMGGIWFYWSDWDWRNDLYIVGDNTITLIHRRPLWLQNEKDLILLNKVDNVVSDTKGVFQNMFNYGDVRISLIGSDRSDIKVFEGVHDPRSVQAEISRRRERAKAQVDAEAEKRQREAIGEYLSVYHETINPQHDNPESQGGAAPPVQDRNRPPNIPRTRLD